MQMDYLISNLTFLNGRPDLNRGQAAAGTTAGVSQSAISKIITQKTKEPGFRTVMGLAKHFGVSAEDLLNRNIAVDGLSGPSHALTLDIGRLGTALTSMDKALKDVHISGRLGKLSKALTYAYLAQDKFKGSLDEMRDVYDELVAKELGAFIDESRRDDEPASKRGEARNRETTAKAKKARAS